MRARSAALLLVLALLSAACGARLTDEQRSIALRTSGAGSSSVADDAGGGAGEDAGAGEGSTDTGAGAGTDPAAPGGGPAGGGGGGGPATTLPPGGNGGATDVGVTATEIRLAVLSDRTGPVPGLFESTIQAMNAWAGYLNSKGGIFGRKIKIIPIDSKTDSGANRAGVLQACTQAFALVGSMSAFDDGGAAPIDQCGIPDISAIPVNPSRGRAKNSFAAFPNVAEWYIAGSKKWVRDTNPGAPDAAAMLWLDAAVTRFNAQKNMEAGASLGYKWVYQRAIAVVEPNYAPFVSQMRDANVQYVSMVADATAVSRLVRAMKQQGFEPKVREFDSVVYDPKFIELAKDAADGVIFSLNIVPFEEASTSDEMQLFVSSLKKAAGSAKPTYFSVYAWSAGRLFEQVATSVGPQLTRAKLLAGLTNVHSWESHGLHANHDVGGRKPSTCFMFMTIEGGKNKRLHPGSGYDCDRAPLYRVQNAG